MHIFLLPLYPYTLAQNHYKNNSLKVISRNSGTGVRFNFVFLKSCIGVSFLSSPLAGSVPVTERSWAQELRFCEKNTSQNTCFRHLLRNFLQFSQNSKFRE